MLSETRHRRGGFLFSFTVMTHPEVSSETLPTNILCFYLYAGKGKKVRGGYFDRFFCADKKFSYSGVSLFRIVSIINEGPFYK